MQKLFLPMAAAGMILARDIATPEGRVLCGKGTVLSEALLDRLRRMEISSLTVEGHPVDITGEPTLEEQLAALDARFSRVKDSKPLLYIKKALAKRLTAAAGPHI